jgi:hypothetical protein
LLNRLNERVVVAEILYEITRDELIDVHMDWQPARLEALKNLRVRGKPWPENWHWDWSAKADNLNFLAYRCFAVECEGRKQGLMMISTIGWRGRSDSQIGKPVLYIEYIESAPWNLAGLVENPQFSGVGIALMQAAIQVSVEEGFAGRIALHSLPQSQPFYRRYMDDLGIDPAHVEKLCYFEMTENQAKEFVGRRPS